MDCRFVLYGNKAIDDPESQGIFNKVMLKAKNFVRNGEVILYYHRKSHSCEQPSAKLCCGNSKISKGRVRTQCNGGVVERETSCSFK